MKKIKIITQSGSDIPKVIAEKYNIHIIPDVIIFGETEYYGGKTITAQEFYKKLAESEQLPTSSQPNIGGFISAYEMYKDYDEILCITVTSKMSGSYNTAVIAAEEFNEVGHNAKVTVFDSAQVSFGMVIMLVKAAKMAEQGMECSEIISNLEKMKNNIGVYFVLASLENARKGGRVGKIRTLAADMLKLKPVLKFDEGVVSDIGVVKNFEQGLCKIAEKFRTMADMENSECYVFHSDNEDGAQALAKKIQSIKPDLKIIMDYVGPVIGIYTGKGCAGIAFMKKENA